MFSFLNKLKFIEDPSVFEKIPSSDQEDCKVKIRKMVHSLLGTSFTKLHKDIVINLLFQNLGEKGPADLCLDLITNRYHC